jgi:folate-binding protein YgfZ
MPAEPFASPAPADAALVAARDAAVVCDLAPLRLLAIGGADAATFLHGQVSADINGLSSDGCRHASFNSPKGRMLANFVLWRNAAVDGGFLALIPADISQTVAKRLSMHVLRSKVTIDDVSADTFRFGVGGPGGADAVVAALGGVPAVFARLVVGSTAVLGLPGSRFVVIASAASAEATRARLLDDALAASYDVWQWLTIRAGVPVVTAATQDMFVAQTANWDLLDGIDFQKGCYTGQEIIARTQYLGRLKERTFLFHAGASAISPGTRIFSVAFADQPCGTVVNAAAAPGGGCDLLAVLQIAAAERGDARLGAPDGPLLALLPLPYAIPAPPTRRAGVSHERKG